MIKDTKKKNILIKILLVSNSILYWCIIPPDNYEFLLAFLQKLQHLQEEKNKEIEILRNTIRDLEQRLNKGQDLHLKRRRFWVNSMKLFSRTYKKQHISNWALKSKNKTRRNAEYFYWNVSSNIPKHAFCLYSVLFSC